MSSPPNKRKAPRKTAKSPIENFLATVLDEILVIKCHVINRHVIKCHQTVQVINCLRH